MSQQVNKETKQLEFLYDWLQIARKPKQTLFGDIKMIFELIGIPTSEKEIAILQKIINPQKDKQKLTKEDFIKCFVIEQQCKKPKEKQLIKAFKYVSKDKQNLQVKELKGYFQEEGIQDETADLIISQLQEYIKDGKFDYNKFASTIY